MLTRSEWMLELKKYISCLPQKEQNKAVDYYVEIFEDKYESGMSEKQIVDGFGDPIEAARLIVREYRLENPRWRPGEEETNPASPPDEGGNNAPSATPSRSASRTADASRTVDANQTVGANQTANQADDPYAPKKRNDQSNDPYAPHRASDDKKKNESQTDDPYDPKKKKDTGDAYLPKDRTLSKDDKTAATILSILIAIPLYATAFSIAFGLFTGCCTMIVRGVMNILYASLQIADTSVGMGVFWIGLGLLLLYPLFFGCQYMYYGLKKLIKMIKNSFTEGV